MDAGAGAPAAPGGRAASGRGTGGWRGGGGGEGGPPPPGTGQRFLEFRIYVMMKSISVADPDPHSFCLGRLDPDPGSALGIRIRIQEGQNNPQKRRNSSFKVLDVFV